MRSPLPIPQEPPSSRLAEQVSEYLTAALWISGTAVVLLVMIFLARWHISGQMPRRSSAAPGKSQKPDAVGTAMAWFQAFKD